MKKKSHKVRYLGDELPGISACVTLSFQIRFINHKNKNKRDKIVINPWLRFLRLNSIFIYFELRDIIIF